MNDVDDAVICTTCGAFDCDDHAPDDETRGEHSRTSPDGSVTVTVPCDETSGELP